MDPLQILQHANIPSDLKGTAFTILQRLCSAFERLPRSFLIDKDFKIQGEIPFATRTYTNLWRRDWNGRGVAVKALRLAPGDGGSRATRVMAFLVGRSLGIHGEFTFAYRGFVKKYCCGNSWTIRTFLHSMEFR